jgi:YNFM family putative membrane transporter
VLILIATASALLGLPRPSADIRPQVPATRFSVLILNRELLRIYFCAAGSFAIFSSIFNYLPFRLAKSPFGLSTEQITFFYAVYMIGIFIGPAAGKISNRFGSGVALIGGSLVLGASLSLILLSSMTAVLLGLLGTCAGFFTIHSAAVGSLNRKLTTDQGRANALYVLFYYLGGWLGITGAGMVFKQSGWGAMICFCAALLLIPLKVGVCEHAGEDRDPTIRAAKK